MKFEEALEYYRRGETIRRKGFKNKNLSFYNLTRDEVSTFDIMSEDWEVIEACREFNFEAYLLEETDREPCETTHYILHKILKRPSSPLLSIDGLNYFKKSITSGTKKTKWKIYMKELELNDEE